MELLLTAALFVGPISLIAGLLVAIVCMARYALATGLQTGAGALLKLSALLVVIGVVSYIVGTLVGMGLFCLPADAGNLCGLGGAIGVGPFVCGIGVGGYAYRWRQRHHELG